MKRILAFMIFILGVGVQADESVIMSCSFRGNETVSTLTGYVVTQSEKNIKMYSIERGAIKKETLIQLPNLLKWDQISPEMEKQLTNKMQKSVLMKTAFIKVLDMSDIQSGKTLVNLYDKDLNNLGGLLFNEKWLDRKCYPLVR